MIPVGSLHPGTVNRSNRLLGRAFRDTAVIAVQNPVRLADDTEPEPDLSVLRPRADLYTASIPVPAEVLLLIEVADTSLLADRLVKIPRYASAGIPASHRSRAGRHSAPDAVRASP